MRTIRPVMIVLGLVLIAGGTAYAATPEEQAVFREDARKLTEHARSQEQQVDGALVTSKLIFISEFKKADGVQDQADVKLAMAYQKWFQGKAPKKAQASLLRESARGLQLEAFELGVRAVIIDQRAGSARAREGLYRTAAAALLDSSDPDDTAVSKEMTQQANAEGRDAKSLENESKSLIRQQASTNKRADSLIARAVELEATSP